MIKIKYTYKYRLWLLLLGIVILSLGFVEGDKTVKKGSSKPYKLTKISAEGGKYGDAYRLFVNNINMPMDRSGKLADVNIPPDGTLGRFNESSFLFSGGFMLSGRAGGTLFSNAVASASLVEDYVPGVVGDQTNAEMYVVKRSDPPGGKAYQDWADAVALGADFYDVDKNGEYDPNIDMPDILGDETVWCVYNDGVAQAGRRWNGVAPIGIEVRQTAFALNSKGSIGNIIFLRYRIKYVGTNKPNEPDKLDDVYFGTWDDPDIGSEDYKLDLVGSDTSRNAIFTYKGGTGVNYGNNPPAFFATFFSGPVEYIPDVTFNDNNGDGEYTEGVDTPIDTAHSVRGRNIGIKDFPGARNLPLSSVIEYFNGFSDPYLNDPDNHIQARNYMLGLKSNGEEVDPCNFSVGTVLGGVNCSTVDPRFWFSGDPVTNIGWIGTQPWDVRQMANTGPFTLWRDTPENREAGRLIEKEIVVAYVVGRGTDRINSITVAREINDVAQKIFDNNFPSPPPPPAIAYEVKTGSDFIDLTWLTAANGPLPIGQNPGDNIRYKGVDTVLNIDRWVHGFYVNAFRTNTSTATVAGENNILELANYSMTNGVDTIKNIYYQDSNGGIYLRRAVAPNGNILDSTFYADPEKGRIKLIINKDPFTGEPLVKGKEYYFSITQYTLNHKAIVNKSTGVYGGSGDYMEYSAYEEFNLLQPLQEIYQGQTQIIKVVFGEDLYAPGYTQYNGTRSSGASSGSVKYLVVNEDELTGNEYSVEFFKDLAASPTSPYLPFWRLRDKTSNQILVDSSKTYDYDTTKYAGVPIDGFLLKVKPVTASFNNIDDDSHYEPAEDRWYDLFLPSLGTGIYYVGSDIPQGSSVTPFPGSARSKVISADRLRTVELRFGDNGKAYRYLNGYIGTNLQQPNSYRYAAQVTAADTIGKGPVGKLGQGFVDVPFTAWDVDERYNTEPKQLAVGFIERRRSGNTIYFGNPNGEWDPGDSLLLSREVIIIFDAPYDPTGSQIEYTGGGFVTSTGTDTVWANLMNGFTIPTDASGITDQQRKIAASPWFNAMYVVGLQKENAASFYTAGDKFIVPMVRYPYTDADVFTFTTRENGQLTDSEKRDLFAKVNVFPNPLYGFNPATSYNNSPADEPFVTFSNLPEEVTIKVYTLSGTLIRTLGTDDKSNPTSPFIKWNLQNEDGLRVASGLYIALISAPGYGEKVLKFSIIMPQKQLQRY
jgi:hypothetical protein